MSNLPTQFVDVIQHREIPDLQNHRPFTWIVNSESEKNSIVLTTNDRFKLLYQNDIKVTFMVSSDLKWIPLTDTTSMNGYSIVMAIVFGGNNV